MSWNEVTEEHMQGVAVLMAVSEQSTESFRSWAWWILVLAYPSLDQRGKSGAKFSKTGLFHIVNILSLALVLLIHVCLIFFTEDYQGNRWNSEQISTPVVLKQTSQAGVGTQMPPLDLCVGFCFKFPNTWGEGMEILVGCKCRLEGVLVCLLLLWGEGPGHGQSILLTSWVGAPPSHKANGTTRGAKQIPQCPLAPACNSSQVKNWPGNMVGAFVSSTAFPSRLWIVKLQDGRKENFFLFDRVPGRDSTGVVWVS